MKYNSVIYRKYNLLLDCCYVHCTYKWKVHNRRMEIVYFVVNFVLNLHSLLISMGYVKVWNGPSCIHCMWYHLFQVQWDIYIVTKHWSVKGHYLYNKVWQARIWMLALGGVCNQVDWSGSRLGSQRVHNRAMIGDQRAKKTTENMVFWWSIVITSWFDQLKTYKVFCRS
jgi:hypothetical protein